MLSRNFRLQKVGDMRWLMKNYNFSKTSYFIDELIVLDVTRGERSQEKFCLAIKELAKGCFVPISAGGGIYSVEAAHNLLRSGADKVVINSALFESNDLIKLLAREFGQQCLVASIDIKKELNGQYRVWTRSGSICLNGGASEWIERIVEFDIGELYINSIDRDGTGQGLDMSILNLIPCGFSKPVVLAGGIGNASHFTLGFSDCRIDALATANLFNFVGDGLKMARQSLVDSGIKLPLWDMKLMMH